ncbi:MAG: FAD-binding protein [Planctomycetes bacterium]|jgi:glycolate oxidase|nr:FAD-binding protein [Planctomycetota bacterium]MBT4559559.1 FAD-binding protein [Planctomycetota bacterium]MBT5100890.1 FAD-binding protein [Planctomycetota bacterium]MBT7011619.1 FAD-binding protein [Planctomycetota bacterium]MBT7318915.1 FAD-binding protein [Planctomycetota bacterium]
MQTSTLSALRAIIGESRVLTSERDIALFRSDALTLFSCKPSAVLEPGSRKEVVACVQVLHAAGIPFTARGAGTGLSAGALVPEGGVLISLLRLNEILEFNEDARFAVVEPGVINAELSQMLADSGLYYAPDPSSQLECTLGGNLAENAGGPHCCLHGMTAQHILFAEVVLADGTVETWGSPTAAEDDFDLRGFLIGSEGSLAIALRIGVRLTPLPETAQTLLGAYPTMIEACATTADIVASGIQPVAMETMDQRTMQVVENSIYAAGLPVEAGAVLIVEVEGTPQQVEQEAAEVEAILNRHEPLRVEHARTVEHRAAIWAGRKGAGRAIRALSPDSYVMDGVVPRSRLVEIMKFVAEIESETGLEIANFFHAGDGNIHPHFCYDASDKELTVKVERAGIRILRKCLELGGSLSGEHGIGLEKEALLHEQFTPETLALMDRLRRVFNPKDLLNPGRGLPLGKGCAEAFHRHGGHSNA